jgi:hypothetical protein
MKRWFWLFLAVLSTGGPAFGATDTPGLDNLNVPVLQESAKKGNTMAILGLGNAYYYGNGVPANAEEAKKWYAQAAEKGSYAAAYSLSLIYAPDQGEADYEKGWYWGSIAMDLTDNELQKQQTSQWLERLSAKIPPGRRETLQKEVETWKQTKKQSAPSGLAKEYTDQAEGILKQAEAGDTNAQSQVANMLFVGIGLKKDWKKALEWFQKVAEKGIPEGQVSLGLMHRNGFGTPVNNVEAYFWISLALKNADGREKDWGISPQIRDELSVWLSDEELAQQEKRLSEWKPQP